MSILKKRFRRTTTLYIFPRGIYKNAKYRLIRFHLLVVVFHKMKCYEIKQANVRSFVYLLFLSLSLCMTQMSARETNKYYRRHNLVRVIDIHPSLPYFEEERHYSRRSWLLSPTNVPRRSGLTIKYVPDKENFNFHIVHSGQNNGNM